eukprot:tig00000806_g4342.t1
MDVEATLLTVGPQNYRLRRPADRRARGAHSHLEKAQSIRYTVARATESVSQAGHLAWHSLVLEGSMASQDLELQDAIAGLAQKAGRAGVNYQEYRRKLAQEMRDASVIRTNSPLIGAPSGSSSRPASRQGTPRGGQQQAQHGQDPTASIGSVASTVLSIPRTVVGEAALQPTPRRSASAGQLRRPASAGWQRPPTGRAAEAAPEPQELFNPHIPVTPLHAPLQRVVMDLTREHPRAGGSSSAAAAPGAKQSVAALESVIRAQEEEIALQKAILDARLNAERERADLAIQEEARREGERRRREREEAERAARVYEERLRQADAEILREREAAAAAAERQRAAHAAELEAAGLAHEAELERTRAEALAAVEEEVATRVREAETAFRRENERRLQEAVARAAREHGSAADVAREESARAAAEAQRAAAATQAETEARIRSLEGRLERSEAERRAAERRAEAAEARAAEARPRPRPAALSRPAALPAMPDDGELEQAEERAAGLARRLTEAEAARGEASAQRQSALVLESQTARLAAELREAQLRCEAIAADKEAALEAVGERVRGTVARLRARLEESEAARQRLEAELQAFRGPGRPGPAP